MDKNNASTDLVALFFTAVAGVGAILAAISPFFTEGGLISGFFIDQSVVKFVSILSLIVLILSVWFFNSPGSFLLFGKGSFTELEKVRFRASILFIILASIFYSIKILNSDIQVSTSLGSIIQFISFILCFGTLGVSVGITISGSIMNFNNKIINSSRIDRVIQVLVKSNILPINLKVLAIEQNFTTNNTPGNEYSSFVQFEIGSNKYVALFYGDFSRMIWVKPLPDNSEDSKEIKLATPPESSL